MSEEKPKENTEEALKDRFAHLNDQKLTQERGKLDLKLSYHHSKEEDNKADKARVLENAAEERKSKLDPLELIRQLDKMREEGFDENVIRAAFDEVMAQHTGNFRRPLRRVLKSDNMTLMPTQAEINKMYEDRYKGIVDIGVNDPSIKAIVDSIDLESRKPVVVKPTFKMYLYRVAYFILRRPLRFAIAFLKALKDESRYI